MNLWSRLIALGAIALAGCSAPADNNTATAECYSSSDCSANKVCRANVCALEQVAPRALGFQLSPAPSSTYPPQRVPIRELPADEAVQIGLEPGVRVAGTLTYVGVELGPGTGRLRFKQLGVMDPFSAETAVENNTYETFVPAGRYDITFFPADTERPTRIWRDVDVALDSDPRLQLVRETVEIAGTLSRTDAVTRDAMFVPNARVFAISEEAGVTSSTSVTGDSGSFSLRVPQDSGSYDLYVSPAEPNAFKSEGFSDYVPEAVFEDAFEVDGMSWENTLDEEGADILGVSLGEYSYAPSLFEFSLMATGEDVDWAGTAVTLRTTAGRGRIAIRQKLDSSGTFALPLVNGIYEVVVRTPPGLPIASARFDSIELNETGIAIELESRQRVGGSVTSPDGAPLSGAQLTFDPTDDSDLREQISAVTDEDGEYVVWLDDTEYDLTVVPSQPDLARFVSAIAADEFDGDVQIPDSILVWGKVFGTPGDGDGATSWRELSDVGVRVLENIDGDTRVVGEGQTDDGGQFRIFIAGD